MKDRPCPQCGAPVRDATNYGSSRWVISWTCGASSNYDGPGDPCPNRDERATRDDATQPPQSDEPEPMTPEITYPEVSTLPAIKPLADQALERLGLAVATVARLKGYKGLVLADLADKKGARELTEKRLEVKKFRTAWVRECKAGREEANAISKGWNSAEKALSEPFEEVEEHLAAQVEAHEGELSRIARETERARMQKVQNRLNAAVAAGVPADVSAATDFDDEDWDVWLFQAIEDKEALDREKAKFEQERNAAQGVAAELTRLGEECSFDEALELTPEQRAYRIQVATADHNARTERQRIADEEAAAEALRLEEERLAQVAAERAARERLERGALRLRELSLLGATADMDALADMTEGAHLVAVETARQDKEARDRLAAEERARQAMRDAQAIRLQQAEDERQRIEAEAQEQRDREAREAQAREHEESIRPEREKITAWAQAALDAMPATPEITDADLLRTMRNTAEEVRSALRWLQTAVEK